MDNFPKDGNHIELVTGLPCRIRQGGDQLYYTDKEGLLRTASRYKWCVVFDEDLLEIVPVKEFKDVYKALDYAVFGFARVLTKAFKELDNYENVTITYPE
jgi:hypothetical protein